MTDAISSILSQIRAHETRMRGTDFAPGNAIAPGALAPGAVGGSAGAPGFQQTLNNAIDSVSRAQNTSGALQQMWRGCPSTFLVIPTPGQRDGRLPPQAIRRRAPARREPSAAPLH